MTKKNEQVEENITRQEMHEVLDEKFIIYAQMSLEDLPCLMLVTVLSRLSGVYWWR